MSDWNWTIDGWIVLVGVLSAVSCALPGNYLVLRRMSLMGDAIAHAVLPGLAIAFLVTQSRTPLPMFIGATVVGVLTALLTQLITSYGKVDHDAAMGVVFSILFAIGLVLIRQVDHTDLDPGCVLYGNLESVGLTAAVEEIPTAAVNLALALLLNLLFVGLFYKELKICAFDPQLATTLGINAKFMHYALMIVVAITTVANFEAVGSILVIAMLIVPAAAAHLLTDRLGVMILLSAVIAAASAVVGHVSAVVVPRVLGYGADVALNTAAMMAVVAGAFFVCALILSPQYGLVSRAWHRAAVSVQIVSEDILGLLYRWEEMRPERGRPIDRREVLAAVGDPLARWALRRMGRRGEIVMQPVAGGRTVALAAAGRERAMHLVRSHRLWEVYLDKHFDLPVDHLHAPAERVEHFITGRMRDELASQLEHQKLDPHGKPIPEETQPSAGDD